MNVNFNGVYRTHIYEKTGFINSFENNHVWDLLIRFKQSST